MDQVRPVKVETESTKRTKNFKECEVSLLLDLVKKHKDVLECKKSDQVTIRDKEKVWGLIQDEFNGGSGVYFRDWKTLKSKYDNLKKSSKRKFAEEKKYVFGTGGGPSKFTDISQTDIKVKELIGDLQSYGAPSQFDSDAMVDRLSLGIKSPKKLKQGDQSSVFDIMNLPVLIEEVAEIDGSFQKPSPIKKDIGLDGIEPTASGGFFVEQSPSKTVNALNKSIGFGEVFSAKNLRAKTSSPLQMRKKKRPALDSTVAGKKIEAMAKAKEEIMIVQKLVSERQLDFQEKEHQAKMLYMKEEHEKKMELLQMQILNEELKVKLNKNKLGLKVD